MKKSVNDTIFVTAFITMKTNALYFISIYILSIFFLVFTPFP